MSNGTNKTDVLSAFGFTKRKIKKSKKEKWLEENSVVLSEIDFYPPQDNRELKSHVCDTDVDTFKKFVEDFNIYLDDRNN